MSKLCGLFRISGMINRPERCENLFKIIVNPSQPERSDFFAA